MRNYDLSPCCVNGSVLTNWPAPCKPPVKAKASRPITSKKATITTTALPLRWPVSVREDLDIQLEGTRLVVKGHAAAAGKKRPHGCTRGW